MGGRGGNVSFLINLFCKSFTGVIFVCSLSQKIKQSKNNISRKNFYLAFLSLLSGSKTFKKKKAETHFFRILKVFVAFSLFLHLYILLQIFFFPWISPFIYRLHLSCFTLYFRFSLFLDDELIYFIFQMRMHPPGIELLRENKTRYIKHRSKTKIVKYWN